MQYRKIKTALARIVLLCMIAALLAPCAFADSSGKVTADYLNVRATASSGATLAGVLPKGATVTILETLDGWYKIQSNGITGYVSSAYISTDGSTTSSSAASSSSATGSAKINAYTVNIRSGAGTDFSVVATVGKGTAVTVTGTEGDWYKVEYNGQSAYVKKDYVTLDGESSSSSSSSSSAASSDKTGTINATYVRLRSGSSTSSSILKTLDKGAQMTVTGESGDWYKVSYSGTEGYVYKTYLTVEGSSSSTAADSGKSGTINATYVRFRASASTSSSILTTFPKGADVTVTATEGDWYKVEYSGQSGYVYKTYVTVEGESAASSSSGSETVESASGTGTIRGSYVRVRAGASTSSSILATVHTGTTMTITGTTGEWYQVSYNGQTGYVYKSYLVDSSSSSSSTGSGSSSSAGEAIVAKAKEYLGVPYVYGGTSPSGFDCSGLVYYVYKQLGYSLYRTATAQYKNGTYVERSDLQAGDILIFYNSGMTGIGHAGIYIGDGQFIHASSGGGKVQINKLSESYYNSHYYGARRVVD